MTYLLDMDVAVDNKDVVSDMDMGVDTGMDVVDMSVEV